MPIAEHDRPNVFVGSDPMLPVPFRVRQCRKDTSDTFTVDLESMASDNGFRFEPETR